MSKSTQKLPEYWEKSSCPLLLRSLCSWNIPVGILEHSSTAPGLSNIHCNAQILSALLLWNPWRIAQLSIFGLPHYSVIRKWVTETHLTHLRVAFRFLGMYIYLSLAETLYTRTIKKSPYRFYTAADLMSSIPYGFQASDLTAHLNTKMSSAILHLSLPQPGLPFYSECQIFLENTSVIMWCFLFISFPGTLKFWNMSPTSLEKWVNLATEEHNMKCLFHYSECAVSRLVQPQNLGGSLIRFKPDWVVSLRNVPGGHKSIVVELFHLPVSMLLYQREKWSGAQLQCWHN